ncbi:MAG: hypothetical protein KAY24_13700 [Candidatus Eisenbacteria sp.]|nr:hypothetical protein [Candidatus Eisenbacteria bacterium]
MSNIIYTPFLNYLRIAADAHAKLVEYIESTGTTQLISDSYEKTAEGQARVVVLFVTVALECYIHNYAARKFGERFTKKHVDSMGHQTKWLVVPKLATGEGIPRDHKAIELLGKLVKARNCVAHAKAINVDPERWDSQKDRIVAENKQVVEAALSAFNCVGELGAVLTELDPDEPSAKLLAEFLKSPRYKLKANG